jgi:hypothetical protein
MALVGDRNCWRARSVDRLEPRVHIEGAAHHDRRALQLATPGLTPPT